MTFRRAIAALALPLVATLTVVVGAAPAGAARAQAALASNRISVHGPGTNRLDTYFSEKVSGHASGKANYLISGEQTSKGSGCASSYNTEKLRGDFFSWPSATGSVHGNFSKVAQFYASHLGTHGLCSYLIHKSTGKTYAHASHFWTNKTQVGGKLEPAPVGSGQCQARSYPDGSVTAQIAVENTGCGVAAAVEAGADQAKGAPYKASGFSCTAMTEGSGSQWSSAWGGTYYAYSCANGSEQVAFNWGTNYTY